MLAERGGRVVELHEGLHVQRQTGQAVVRAAVQRQPRQRVVPLQHVPEAQLQLDNLYRGGGDGVGVTWWSHDLPENVGGGLRVEGVRVVVAALHERGEVVGGLRAAGVQMQRVLKEGGTGVAQVRAARPPPGRHGAQRRRRHQVPQCQRLLQDRAHLLLKRTTTHNVSLLPKRRCTTVSRT